MSMQVSYKKQILFFTLLILILLGSVEIGARAWWVSIENCAFENSEIYQDIPYSLKRQICVESYNIQYSPERIEPNQNYETVNINSVGFRGDDISLEKPNDTIRIFGLGGSTMFGVGSTSDITTIPGSLQQKFDNEHFEKKIQVINAGVSDGWSQTESNLVKHTILDFSPDLLIVYDGWNDAQNIEQVPDTQINQKISQWVERWDEICTLGKERNFKTIIIIQPLVGTSNRELSEEEYANFLELSKTNILPRLELFAAALKELNSCTATYDFRNVFDGIEKPVFWDQGHVGNVGNEIIAQNMFEVIKPLISDISQTSYDVVKNNTNTTNDEKINEYYYLDVITLLKRTTLQYYKTPLLVNHFLKSYQETNLQFVQNQNLLIDNVNHSYKISDSDFSKKQYFEKDFSNQNMTGSYFFSAYLRKSSFENSILTQANMTFANLSGANLKNSTLHDADLRQADLSNVNLQYSNLRGANLFGTTLFSTNFQNADLVDAKLSKSNLLYTDFSHSNLTNADLSGLDLRTSYFIGADLSYADLSGSFLYGQTILNSKIHGTNLNGVTFYEGVDFSNQDLSDSDFSFSSLINANFTNTVVTNTNFEGAIFIETDFRNSNLEDAKGQPFIGCINHQLCQN